MLLITKGIWWAWYKIEWTESFLRLCEEESQKGCMHLLTSKIQNQSSYSESAVKLSYSFQTCGEIGSNRIQTSSR